MTTLISAETASKQTAASYSHTDEAHADLAEGPVQLDVVNAAERGAAAAAAAARVTVRPLLSLEELTDGEALLAAVWGAAQGKAPMNRQLLKGTLGAQSYVAGAFDGTSLIGICVGFWGPPRSGLLYSHIAGVSEAARGRRVGYAMKLHQRAWALSLGASTIAWTYDPLVARNAHFNLHRLAAHPVSYHPDYYGAMTDSLNGGDHTDRFLVHWDLAASEVRQAIDAPSSHLPPADVADHGRLSVASESQALAPRFALLSADAQQRPVARDADPSATSLLVAVPSDVESLRSQAPETARAWRSEVRRVVTAQLDAGAQVIDFDRQTSSYVLRKEPTR